MKRIIAVTAFVLACGPAVPAKAQTVLDLSLITCQQLLASDAERQALIGSWMSGYLSASKNLDTVDFRYVQRKRSRQLLQGASRNRHERHAEEFG
jgi:acid stress chaperone HdeB